MKKSTVPKYFEEDLKFLEEWLEKPQLTEDCTVIEEEEDCIIDTKIESIYDEKFISLAETKTSRYVMY